MNTTGPKSTPPPKLYGILFCLGLVTLLFGAGFFAPSSVFAKATETARLKGLAAKIEDSYNRYAACMKQVEEIIHETVKPQEFPDTRDREKMCYRQLYNRMAQVKNPLEKSFERIKKLAKTNPDRKQQKGLESLITVVMNQYTTVVRNVERHQVRFTKEKELFLKELEAKQQRRQQPDSRRHPLELNIDD